MMKSLFQRACSKERVPKSVLQMMDIMDKEGASDEESSCLKRGVGMIRRFAMNGTRQARRAEITSQMLFYVAGTIVAVALLVFGFNAIRDLKDASTTAVDARFQNDVVAFFESVQSSPFGTVIRNEFGVLRSHELICFVKRNPGPGAPSCGDSSYCLYEPESGSCVSGASVPLLVDIACTTQSEENVFLVDGGEVLKFKTVDFSFHPQGDSTKCFPTGSSQQISFVLESRGKQIEIHYAGVPNG